LSLKRQESTMAWTCTDNAEEIFNRLWSDLQEQLGRDVKATDAVRKRWLKEIRKYATFFIDEDRIKNAEF